MKKFNILITDNISEEGIKILKQEQDINIDFKLGIKSNELKDIIGQYDAIITRSGHKYSKN